MAGPSLAGLICAGLAGAGMAQTLAGWLVARHFARAPGPGALDMPPPVTVLKPLYGTEPMLEAALETLFRQDFPRFQLVFGVQRSDDAAIATVRRLLARYKDVDARLVVDARLHGANRKIGNLINMLPAARHDVLVISDSDMHVAPDYLSRVCAALAPAGTGLVTTVYTGLPAQGGITQQLGAAYINQIFAAGALMARGLGRQDCMGATMALTRQTLREIGGLEALVPYVADDGVLGRLVRGRGLRVALARTVPATTVGETGIIELLRHELRWARTIRAMAPLGFAASVIQYPVFWALLAVVLAGPQEWTLALLACAAALRIGAGRGIERALGAPAAPLWLAPLRDVVSVGVMAAAYLNNRVAWRGQVMSTAPDRDMVRRAPNFISPPPAMAHGEG